MSARLTRLRSRMRQWTAALHWLDREAPTPEAGADLDESMGADMAAPTLPDQPGRWFTWRELTRSSYAASHGLDNTPPPDAAANLVALCDMVLDPLRDAAGPIRVQSGYRSPTVNKGIGGSVTSDHKAGWAADVSSPTIPAPDLAALIVSLGLPYDQVIWYDPHLGGHVHVSAHPRQRREVLHRSSSGYHPWRPPTV